MAQPGRAAVAGRAPGPRSPPQAPRWRRAARESATSPSKEDAQRVRGARGSVATRPMTRAGRGSAAVAVEGKGVGSTTFTKSLRPSARTSATVAPLNPIVCWFSTSTDLADPRKSTDTGDVRRHFLRMSHAFQWPAAQRTTHKALTVHGLDIRALNRLGYRTKLSPRSPRASPKAAALPEWSGANRRRASVAWTRRLHHQAARHVRASQPLTD